MFTPPTHSIKANAYLIFSCWQSDTQNRLKLFFGLICFSPIFHIFHINYEILAHYPALLLRHWYEIMALYYVKSILTEISASRQDRRVLQKSKIIRIRFLIRWGTLEALATSRNLEKTIYYKCNTYPAPYLVYFWTNLHEILAPFLKLNFLTTLFSTFLQ